MEEIEELESSNTKRILFALGGVIVVVAALVWFFSSKGKGQPEEDHKLLILDDAGLGLATFATNHGFEAISGGLEAWQRQVAEDDKVDVDGASDVDLAEILDYADHYGYGFVVVVDPGRFDLGGLEIEGPKSFAESTRFAVFSVGDFAHPHVVTTAPEGFDAGPGATFLAALFEQPRLAEILDEDNKSNAAQTRRLQLIDAVEAHERNLAQIARLETMRAEIAEQAASITTVDGQPARPLQAALEGATPVPMVDGRVLVRSSGGTLRLTNGKIRFRTIPGANYEAIPVGTPSSADARVACPEFLGGHSTVRLARMEPSARGDALFVLDRYGEGGLFHHDPGAGPCGLALEGAFEIPDLAEAYFAVRRGMVAARSVEGGELRLEVVEADGTRTRLPGVEVESASSLIWLEGGWLAALARDFDGSKIVLAHLDAPERVAVLPLADPDDPEIDLSAREIQAIPGAKALVLRWNRGDQFLLSRLDLGAALAELAEPDDETEPISDENADPLAAPPRPLSPEAVTWTSVLSVDNHVRGFDVHRDGTLVALTVEGDLGVDVATVPLPGPGGSPGELRRIVDDTREHREVAFREPQGELLFRTRVRLDDLDATLLATHAIALQ